MARQLAGQTQHQTELNERGREAQDRYTERKGEREREKDARTWALVGLQADVLQVSAPQLISFSLTLMRRRGRRRRRRPRALKFNYKTYFAAALRDHGSRVTIKVQPRGQLNDDDDDNICCYSCCCCCLFMEHSHGELPFQRLMALH